MAGKLFEEGKIGKLSLKNRIVMPAMATGFASSNGEASEEIIKYYEARAKGGCGLIITEITRIDEETGITVGNQLGLTKSYQIKQLSHLVDAVHQYDTRLFVQLHHPGRQTSSQMLDGRQIVAPSPIPCKVVKEMPRELTLDEIHALVKKFVVGAYLAKTAGVDGVELHAAHGYLISQFLSPYTNQRQDQYGGSFENRARFLTEIILGIRQALGPDFPIIVRLNGRDFLKGGLELDEQVKLAQHLESLGVAAINVSCGMYESGWTIIEPAALPEGWKKDLAKTIKAHVHIPVIAVNNIKHPATAEQLLEEGVCDFVGLGRSQLADPEFGNKAKAGKAASIRPCVGCCYCFKELNTGRPLSCTVNPLLGREYLYNEHSLEKNGKGRRVAIIGGGPAGIQAAITLAKRDFRPVIFEKADKLGGSLLLADQPPYKSLLTEFYQTLQGELKELEVEVHLNTEVKAADLSQDDYYGVVAAIGGKPFIPPVKGSDQDNVYLFDQLLSHSVSLKNQRVIVIGGGETGLETAEFLADAGNQVTVVEMMDAIGQEMDAGVLGLMMKRFEEKQITILKGHKAMAIQDKQVVLQKVASGEEVKLETDSVVIASGILPDQQEIDELKQAHDHLLVVGDAYRPGNIAKALKEAHDKCFVF